jgi:hypothetical protein
MRGTWIAAAVVLAFAAGWFSRGCAGGDAPTGDAAATATTQPAEPATRVHRETTNERTAAPARPGPELAPSRGARAASGATDGSSESPQPESAPANGEVKPLTRVAGVVVDSATGEGLMDVSVQLRALREDSTPDGSSMGARTDSNGRFEFDQLMDWIVHARHLGICAGRDGWRIARVPVETEDVRIELERETTAPRPGRIVGTAWAENGKPLTGRLFVCIREGSGCEWRAAVTDGKAAFTSVPLGKWRAVLVRPGEADIGVDVELKAGDGACLVELPGAK